MLEPAGTVDQAFERHPDLLRLCFDVLSRLYYRLPEKTQ